MISLNNLPNMEHGETTELFTRRHWIYVAQLLGAAIALLLIPVVLYALIQAFNLHAFSTPFWSPILAVSASVYVLIVLVVVQTQFTDYYLDTWIVTSERIINIEQNGLFSRVISELHLNQVQDVTAETEGMTATFLKFGNVYIQTAGTRERFNFKGVAKPEEIKETILRLARADKLRHGDASIKKG